MLRFIFLSLKEVCKSGIPCRNLKIWHVCLYFCMYDQLLQNLLYFIQEMTMFTKQTKLLAYK